MAPEGQTPEQQFTNNNAPLGPETPQTPQKPKKSGGFLGFFKSKTGKAVAGAAAATTSIVGVAGAVAEQPSTTPVTHGDPIVNPAPARQTEAPAPAPAPGEVHATMGPEGVEQPAASTTNPPATESHSSTIETPTQTTATTVHPTEISTAERLTAQPQPTQVGDALSIKGNSETPAGEAPTPTTTPTTEAPQPVIVDDSHLKDGQPPTTEQAPAPSEQPPAAQS